MWSLFCTDGYLLKVRITLLVRNGSKYLEERKRSKLLGGPLIAVAKGTFEVRQAGLTQSLSYPLRLPDEAQTDALRLLDVSREVINAGESLKSLKSTGRGRDAKGRWRNWRNNAQVRGELWRVLRYKCHLVGRRLEWQQPRKTSHTCPHCGTAAQTYRDPSHLDKVEDWGAWLCCGSCGWNGSRDYAASLNIARLGATFITHYLETSRYDHASIADKAVKPLSYMGSGSALRLPSMVPRSHLLHAGKIYVNGWRNAVKLHSSYVTETMLRLCG